MNCSELYQDARRTLNEEKDYDKAIDLFKKVIEECPDSDEARYARSLIINAQNEKKEKSKEGKSKDKKRSGWWPDVSTPSGRQDAINGGAFVAIWMVISYLINSVLLYFTGKGLFTGEAATESKDFIFILNFIFIILASFLGWRVWKKAGHISAIMLFIWVVMEVIFKAMKAPGKGIVVGIILLLCALHGIRGTFAKKRSNAIQPLVPGEE